MKHQGIHLDTSSTRDSNKLSVCIFLLLLCNIQISYSLPVSNQARAKAAVSNPTKLFATFQLPENQGRPIPLPQLQYKTSPSKSAQKPILVIGATGQIGRIVVRELLKQNLPVRAFVRDYELACEIFSKYIDESGMELVSRGEGAGNKNLLTILEGDLVPEDASEEDDYGYEALESALKGCGTIISCAGTVRNSKLSDYFPPTRIWKKDVRKWCRDRRHPYYVNYIGMKKMIEFVKAEIKSREKKREQNEKHTSSSYSENSSIPKEDGFIIVRISDLNTALPPWSLTTVVVNLARSMVFRYQEMAEQVLIRESSEKIKTVILRPGDLIDIERDTEKANLEISASGVLPTPAFVGREDVAALAVAAALSSNEIPKTIDKSMNASYSRKSVKKDGQLSLPNSLTLAVRWVGEDIYPQSQGKKGDGYKDAQTCFNMLQNKGNQLRLAGKKVRPIPSSIRKGAIQGYGVYASIAMYSVMAVFGRILFHEFSHVFRRALPLVAPIMKGVFALFSRKRTSMF